MQIGLGLICFKYRSSLTCGTVYISLNLMAKYDARNTVNKASEWSTFNLLYLKVLMLIFFTRYFGANYRIFDRNDRKSQVFTIFRAAVYTSVFEPVVKMFT